MPTLSYTRAFCLSSAVLLLLSACESYDVTLNDRVLYTPSSLLSDLEVDDTALHQCLRQAIKDNQVGEAAQLTTLNCSHAGISNLTGLGRFTGITRLKLSDNDIRNLMELQDLTALVALELGNNRVVDPVPLYPLRGLRELDLSGNPDLQCPDTAALAHVTDLTLPGHCRADINPPPRGLHRQ